MSREMNSSRSRSADRLACGRGFTIIELLMVIAILSMLVTILMPTLGRAKQIARGAACQLKLHGVGNAFRMYLNDSNETMPVAAAMPSLNLNDEPRIADVLAKYVTDPRTLRCPGDRGRNYFESEGSSYEYNTMLGGRRVSDTFLTKRFGEDKTPVMYDYRPFHGRPGQPGAANYLFADMHVGDLR